MSNKMKVEIWSDVVCPWCYIGKRRFEAALAQFPDAGQIEIQWKSFQLDPTTPANSSIKTKPYLAKKYGITEEKVEAMTENVTQVAAEEGLEFNLGDSITVNTFKAHRFIHFSESQGKQSEAKERLLHAYFTENLDVDNDEVLMGIGVNLGLNPQQISKVLSETTYSEAVKKDFSEAQALGITGVPFFAFDRKYGVSGAQSSAVFLQYIEKAFSEWKEKNKVTKLEVLEGQVCKPDGQCD